MVVLNAYTVRWLAAVGSLEERLGVDPKLVPNTQERVPGACRYRHAVLRHAQAGHAIIVAGEDPWKINVEHLENARISSP